MGDSGEVRAEAVEALPDRVEIDITETPIYQALKQHRYETSKAEGVKAYYVYNNLQLEAIIEAMPRNLDELRKVSGFGEVKCEKYGDGIVEIVGRYKDKIHR